MRIPSSPFNRIRINYVPQKTGKQVSECLRTPKSGYWGFSSVRTEQHPSKVPAAGSNPASLVTYEHTTSTKRTGRIRRNSSSPRQRCRIRTTPARHNMPRMPSVSTIPCGNIFWADNSVWQSAKLLTWKSRVQISLCP